MLSPIPLLIKRSAYQVWPTTVALSTPPGFLVHFRRNTTTSPQKKSNDWGTLSPPVLGKPSYQIINHAEVMDLQLASFSCQSEAWETQRLIHPAPMTTMIKHWWVFQSDRTEGWGMVFGGLRHWDVVTWPPVPLVCLIFLHGNLRSSQAASWPSQPHIVLFRNSRLGQPNHTWNVWQKRKLWDLSKIAFQFPNFSCWMQMNLNSTKFLIKIKSLACETETAGCRPCLVTTCCFCPGIHASGNTSSPYQFRLNPSKQPHRSLLLGSGAKKNIWPTGISNMSTFLMKACHFGHFC